MKSNIIAIQTIRAGCRVAFSYQYSRADRSFTVIYYRKHCSCYLPDMALKLFSRICGCNRGIIRNDNCSLRLTILCQRNIVDHRIRTIRTQSRLYHNIIKVAGIFTYADIFQFYLKVISLKARTHRRTYIRCRCQCIWTSSIPADTDQFYRITAAVRICCCVKGNHRSITFGAAQIRLQCVLVVRGNSFTGIVRNNNSALNKHKPRHRGIGSRRVRG